DDQPLRFIRLVSGELCLERVGAGRYGRKVVLPDGIGDDLARDVRRLVDQRHGDAGNHAVLIADLASHSPGELLRANDRAEEQKYRAKNPPGYVSVHDIPP